MLWLWSWRGDLADSYCRGFQGERHAMMVFWECDGLRSVAALPATGEESLEVYIWIPATRFEREGPCLMVKLLAI
jgi:hypothetical protein